MKKPKLSVFMPVYNSEAYLAEAIESILAQTFSDFELIIIDDASTDSSYGIIEKYAREDDRIKTYRNRANSGIAMTCNKAVYLSGGEYIARMDSDDIALKHRLEVQWDFMRTNRHLSLCGGWAYIIDERGREIGTFKRPCGWKKINRIIRYTNPVIHPTSFMVKRGFLQVGGYRNFSVSSDYDLLLRMNCAGMKFDNVPTCVLSYRVRASSITHLDGVSQRIMVNAIRELHKERKRRGVDRLDQGVVTIRELVIKHDTADKAFERATQMHLEAQRALANRSFLRSAWNYSRAFLTSRLKRHYFVELVWSKIILMTSAFFG